MPKIAALYRYPIKGLEPERLSAVRLQSDGRIAGDRVLTFRYADALVPQARDGLDYWPKGGGLCVRDYPGLTRLKLRYDADALAVEITGPDGLFVRENLDESGREALAEAVTEIVRATPEGQRLDAPGRLPLHVIGDGVRARFQDRAPGFVSVHNRASLAALEEATGESLDEVRFRSNIALDGMEPWEEDRLIGSYTRMGGVLFRVHKLINRCLAIHANPVTGRFDVPIMQTLTRVFGRAKPSFGFLLLPVADAGAAQDAPGASETHRAQEIHVGEENRAAAEIRVGDTVTFTDAG